MQETSMLHDKSIITVPSDTLFVLKNRFYILEVLAKYEK